MEDPICYELSLNSNSRRTPAHTLQRLFDSAQPMQLLPWPDYSSNMLSIEHVWDFMGRRLARDPRPARVPLYRTSPYGKPSASAMGSSAQSLAS
ncbi:hypothetical protein TNCV_398311 [Trichonephila clavipes]|nr:hypothetical protein TNCV_398311 [Trichonephila clavipes]